MCAPTVANPNAAAAPPAAVNFYDPYAPKQAQYSPSETAALLDLLAVDNLIDSKSPLLAEEHEIHLLNDLLAVDLEFSRAKFQNHSNVITASELTELRDVFLDLLAVDQEVDHAASRRASAVEQQYQQHHSSTTALCDPYAPKAHSLIHPFTGVYAADNDGVGGASEEQQLRDNAILMYLLAVDESVDQSKRWNKFVESDSYEILEDLYLIDKEISGAKTRETLVEDLQCLLDVDYEVDSARRT